ncbi:MAG: serine/threonine-protein phosphatase, partial [Planctomycetia bacterium]|nr:serine/threonine-protein phosphatase [Planctomycetia bacterium]
MSIVMPSTVAEFECSREDRVPARPPCQVRCFGATDPGKVRPNNEDQFLIAEVGCCLRPYQSSLHELPVQCGPRQGYLFVVADGMGGHRAGERASALAVDCVKSDLLATAPELLEAARSDPDPLQRRLEQTISHANDCIWRASQRQPQLRGMGTTLTVAFYLEPHLLVAHAGDSRCYLIRDGWLHRLTRDHTLAQDMLDRGKANVGDTIPNAWRHILTNSVGGSEQGVRADSCRLTLRAGDGILLCSDGLTDMLSDEEIAAIIRKRQEPHDICKHLIQQAKEASGRDNITAVVALFR